MRAAGSIASASPIKKVGRRPTAENHKICRATPTVPIPGILTEPHTTSRLFRLSLHDMATHPSLCLVVRLGSSGTTSERQVGASSTPSNRFSFVAGLGPVPGPVAPVTRSDRRPFQGDMVDHVPKSPACVFGCDPWRTGMPRHRREHARCDPGSLARRIAACDGDASARDPETGGTNGPILASGRASSMNLSVVIVNQYVFDPLGIDGAQQP